MGLDIRAYENVKFVCSENQEEKLEYIYPNPSFLDQADGLQKGYYEKSEYITFHVGSYSTYNNWRDTLADMIGVMCDLVWVVPHEYKDKPFFELINFSDCEGVIGPKTSAKLAKDFRDHHEMAKQKNEKLAKDSKDNWFLYVYERFMEAFELAASGEGAVQWC